VSQPPEYSLVFAPAALRSLRKLDQQAAKRIKAAAEDLRKNPHPHGLKPVLSMPGVFRVRVGDYRILYTIDNSELRVIIVDAGHRKAIYQQAQRRLSTGGGRARE
jgi:mRNA interferase RelE/StbE